MAKLKSFLISFGVILLAGIAAFLSWQVFGPAAAPSQVKLTADQPKQLKLTAVGDSLTYGVGDATNNGGFVGLTQADLEATGQYQVMTKNYGVSGNTSTQILSRINKQAKIRTDLKQANIITVTAGGNDLMHVLQQHFLSLSEKEITAGSTAFQKHLTTLLTTIRKENATAPIYVFGIYNPFYVYQYATGISAAIALSKKIMNKGESAVKDYMKFLTGGGSKDPIDLLKMAGVNMAEKEPIQQALNLFGDLLDQMEEIVK